MRTRSRIASILLLVMGWPASALADASVMMGKAEKSYFAGHLDKASAHLDEAEKMEMASREVTAQRARIHLFRAAVRVKQGNRSAAEESARKALFLDPELDARILPPSAQDLVDQVRQALPARVIVKVTGVTDGVDARVDGRPVPAIGVLAVVPGQHQLAVRTAGKTSLLTFTATEDIEVHTSTAIATATASPTPSATPVAIATASPTPVAIATPKPAAGPGQTRSRGKPTAGYVLAAVAVTGAGAAGHGFWARSVSLENRSKTATRKSAYDDDVRKFTAQTAAGGGIALVAGGLSLWLLSSGSRKTAYVSASKDEVTAGFTMEFGGNDR